MDVPDLINHQINLLFKDIILASPFSNDGNCNNQSVWPVGAVSNSITE